MGKRRSMLRKKKRDDASCMKTIKTWDNGVVASLSDLTDDVVLLVMMKLEVVDFLAFSRVCKSWRSLAVSNRNKFIVSRPPMSISKCTNSNKKTEYYLKDSEGRKLKMILPHSAKRMCVGVTCGYLVFYYEETNDFWLLNTIKKHKLHFPDIPFCCPGNGRVILFYSPSISKWVLVVSNTCNHQLWCSIVGKLQWTKVSTPFYIRDLIAFKGKIYILHSDCHKVRLCEMQLYPEPKVVLVEIESFPKPHFKMPGFVSCGENLYLIDRYSESELAYKIHEVDFSEMKLVSCKKMGNEYAFFLNKLKYGDVYSNADGYVVGVKRGKGGLFYESMWYFFHDCLNVSFIH